MGKKAEWQVVRTTPKGGAVHNGNTAVAEPEAAVGTAAQSATETIAAEDLIQSSEPKKEMRSSESVRQPTEGPSAKVVDEPESVQRVKFPPVKDTMVSAQTLEKIEYLRDVDLEASVELGNAILSVEKILTLDVGSVVELTQTVGEEVRLLINGNAYAYGEVVVIGEKFGVRLTRIIHS